MGRKHCTVCVNMASMVRLLSVILSSAAEKYNISLFPTTLRDLLHEKHAS